MKFLGNNNEINIKTKNPEFLDWKWLDPLQLSSIAVNFKAKIYKKIENELKSLKLS